MLSVKEDLPHRKASNSCKKILNDMIACYQNTICYKKQNSTFEECLHNHNLKEIDENCIILRKAYAQCRRNLLNGNFKLIGNPLSR
ncbi:cytochrome c oxidase assembly protein, putative [Plasmodium malariae]|uniref:Cytochrome c oxidase assembly protein, putative n=1 Tax=Plasmodium malariae TaxID=5858 RepID=A0A1C3KLR6_PLAMA|nr:cytochrome c oxidase assembly protein, putative [Plasmodium malariae]